MLSLPTYLMTATVEHRTHCFGHIYGILAKIAPNKLALVSFCQVRAEKVPQTCQERAVAVAQLVERWHLIPEVGSSNPVIGKN